MRTALTLAVLGGFLVLASAEDKKPAAEKKAERFDLVVREDIFAGFTGDDEAMARGLKKCEEALQKNPKHAEAMVWRGAGRVYQAGQLFEKKKTADGATLWAAGLEDLDRAVELEPDSVGVRIPRAAVLMQAGRSAPAALGKPLLKKALEDFEKMYKKQEKELATIGTHPRGELHMGLADAYRALGEADKSKAQLEAVVRDMPDTKYAKRAKEWLAAKPDAKLAHDCIGCHKK